MMIFFDKIHPRATSTLWNSHQFRIVVLVETVIQIA